jgi:hypothetical protein
MMVRNEINRPVTDAVTRRSLVKEAAGAVLIVRPTRAAPAA